MARDNIVATDPKYETFSNWADLSIDDGHAVLKGAVELFTSNEPLSLRFHNLRSTDPKERDWLLDLLDTWFFKQWNNKKNQDMKKAFSPAKKRPADDCPSCSHELQLVCINPDCTECIFNVFLHFQNQALISCRATKRGSSPHQVNFWKQHHSVRR
jgi:hypothetical protein